MFNGETCSFIELAAQCAIEIPVIQRDYAQGRQVGKAPMIRNIFLNDLYKVIQDWDCDRQAVPLELHFIYGTMEGEKFIPLDGQQRLTTLFLLHWYLALKEGGLDQELTPFSHATEKGQPITVRKALLHFCYRTRKSSEKFIHSLVQQASDELLQESFVEDHTYKNEVVDIFKAYGNKKNTIAENIINKGWFFPSWENDPTVASMLIMLEAIHEKFRDAKGFLAKLVSVNPPVTFRILDIEQKNEDVFYIRMNSRGKALTNFENFKAELLGCMRDKVQKSTFVERVECSWPKFFWQYRNEAYLYDDQMLNSLRALFTYELALSEATNKQTILERFINDAYLPFETYRALDLLVEDKLNGVQAKMDVLCQYTHLMRRVADKNMETILGREDVNNTNNLSLLNRMMNNYNVPEYTDKLSYPERVWLYAYVCFFEEKECVTDADDLRKWLRVTRHLIQYSQIDTGERFSSALRGIREMLPGRQNIYAWLESDRNISFFRGEICKEECLKAVLRQRQSWEWNSLLSQTEEHPYLDGQIMFLLEYAEITKEKVVSWTADSEKEAYDRLKDYFERFQACFNADGCIYSDEKNEYLWQRALLTVGDYLLPYKSNYSFLSNGKGNLFRLDVTWKWLFQAKTEGDDQVNRTEYVKLLLQAIDKNNVRTSLKNICEVFINKAEMEGDWWRYYFVKYPELIQHCGRQSEADKYFIRWNGYLDISLMETSRLSGANREYYTAALQCYLKDKYGVEVEYPSQTGNEVNFIERIGNKKVKIEFVVGEANDTGYFLAHRSSRNGGDIKFREYEGDELVRFDDIEEYLLQEHIITGLVFN